MDNAPCQTNKKVITAIKEHPTIRSAGFQSETLNLTLRSDKGIPPNSPDTSWLDCGVFGPLDTKFRDENPQTIEEAMKVAKRLWKEVKLEDIRALILEYPERLKEIARNEGGNSNWLRSIRQPRKI